MIKVKAKTQGVALILVLLLTAVISVVVISVQYRSKMLVHQSAQIKQKLDAKLELQSLKAELHFLLSTTTLWLLRPSNELRAEFGIPEGFNFYGKPFMWHNTEVTLTDTSGLVALIPFNEHNWRQMLVYHGIADVEPIIASLKDWYDEDDFLHLYGAERGEYAKPGLPRNDLPQVLDEIALVKNITPEIYNKIKPWLTHIGQDEVSIHHAPASMLEAFIGEFRAKEMITSREQDGISADIMQVFSENTVLTPTNRVAVKLVTNRQSAAYSESFVYVKNRGNPRDIYIAEWQVGNSEVPIK